MGKALCAWHLTQERTAITLRRLPGGKNAAATGSRLAAARVRTEENARQDQAGILVSSREDWPGGPRQHTARQ
jgi:hypothetical protein